MDLIARAIPADENAALNIRVVEALSVVELPLFSEIRIDKFIDIRNSEEAFSEWRCELRLITRLLKEASGEPGFESQALSIFSDALSPKIEAIQQAMSRSYALRSVLREQPLRATLGAFAAGGVALATNTPPKVAALSAAGGGLAQLLATVLVRPRPSGSAAIIREALVARAGFLQRSRGVTRGAVPAPRRRPCLVDHRGGFAPRHPPSQAPRQEIAE